MHSFGVAKTRGGGVGFNHKQVGGLLKQVLGLFDRFIQSHLVNHKRGQIFCHFRSNFDLDNTVSCVALDFSKLPYVDILEKCKLLCDKPYSFFH